MKNTVKYLAHILIEAATPIAIGTGEKGMTTDRLIARDANDLPYIPGTSLAGVIRHELEDNGGEAIKNNLKEYFGFQDSDKDKDKEGKGSDIIFSAAHILDTNGKAVEGLKNINFEDEYFSCFNRLPNRDHVRITDMGVAKKHGKFDEELVHKGSRFAFRIELEANDNEQDIAIWNNILSVLQQPTFRLGAGTRKGFGKFDVIHCQTKIFNLTEKNQLLEYLALDSSLNIDVAAWQSYKVTDKKENWLHYQVKINPESFYLFGAGFGNEEVDMQPKTESYFEWDKSGKNPKLIDFDPENKKQGKILIPATSVKGAIAHRVAFHYNQNTGKTIENNTNMGNATFDIETVFENTSFISIQNKIAEKVAEINLLCEKGTELLTTEEVENLDAQLKKAEDELVALSNKVSKTESDEILKESGKWQNYNSGLRAITKNNDDIPLNTGFKNEAVKALFGYEKNKYSAGAIGNVIISDVYLQQMPQNEHIFNHIAIDRFTGGGIDGALYSEKAVKSEEEIVLHIYLQKDDKITPEITKAFEQTLNDLSVILLS